MDTCALRCHRVASFHALVQGDSIWHRKRPGATDVPLTRWYVTSRTIGVPGSSSGGPPGVPVVPPPSLTSTPPWQCFQMGP